MLGSGKQELVWGTSDTFVRKGGLDIGAFGIL